jgi:hypothetical protein
LLKFELTPKGLNFITKIYHKITVLPEHLQSDAVNIMLFWQSGKENVGEK